MTQVDYDACKQKLDECKTIEELRARHKEVKENFAAFAKNQFNANPEEILASGKDLFTEPTLLEATSAPAEGNDPQKAPQHSPFKGGFRRRSKAHKMSRRIVSDSDGDETMHDRDDTEPTIPEATRRMRKSDFVLDEASESGEDSEFSESEFLSEIKAMIKSEEEETFSKLCDDCGERTKVGGSNLCSQCKRKSIRQIAAKERAEKNRKERHLKMMARDQAKRKKQAEIARKFDKYINIMEKLTKKH